MANVTVTDNSVTPKTITIDGAQTITVSDSAKPTVTVVTDTLSINQTGVTGVSSVNGETGDVTLNTDDISQGSTNLYYADSLVDAHLTGGTGVTYSAGDISIGQPVATTDDVTFNTVTATDEFLGSLDGAVRFTGKNVSGGTIEAGQVVYISGLSGNTPEVDLAQANSSSTMPAFGIAVASVGPNNPGQFATFGSQRGLDVADFGETGITFNLGDTLYISASEAGHITNVAPTGESNFIQNIGKIERATPTTNMTIKVGGAGRSNATPALNDGNIFIGNASNQSVTSSLDTEVSGLGYITASSTDTLTNKSGNISQWTNDAGYLTSETDSQTLSFTSPNLTISNGNTVDISGITSGSLENVSEDLTPSLGGDLDVGDQSILTTGAGGLINIVGSVLHEGNYRLKFPSATYYTSLSAHPSQTENYSLVWPAANGTAGQILKLESDGSGGVRFGFADDSGGIALTDISVGAEGTASGDGSLAYNNTTGEFTYTPPVLSGLSGDSDDIAEGATNQYYTDAKVQAISINALSEDASPSLSATLDANGNNINDTTRDYVIVGDNNSPSANDYDSMSGSTPGQRVEGVITIGESSGGTDRFHGNPRLNLHTLTADRTDNNARFRMNYTEGVLDTAGFDTTQTGFGRGHHGMFLSGKVRNSGGSASTVNQVRAITMSPQIDGLTSDLTVDDMRACEVQPFIASGGTVNNMYGFHYSLSNSGTVTNQYSFYGAESGATMYNAGDIETDANLIVGGNITSDTGNLILEDDSVVVSPSGGDRNITLGDETFSASNFLLTNLKIDGQEERWPWITLDEFSDGAFPKSIGGGNFTNPLIISRIQGGTPSAPVGLLANKRIFGLQATVGYDDDGAGTNYVLPTSASFRFQAETTENQRSTGRGAKVYFDTTANGSTTTTRTLEMQGSEAKFAGTINTTGASDLTIKANGGSNDVKVENLNLSSQPTGTPTNTTTPAGYIQIEVNGSTAYMPYYT